MKATGIVRRIDDLGRIVIPKEIRKTMHINEGDPLEIYTQSEGEIILKKYSPMGELRSFAEHHATALSKIINIPVIICDRDSIIAVAGMSKREIIGKPISQELKNILQKRQIYIIQKNKTLYPTQEMTNNILVCSPIISSGDLNGAIIFLSTNSLFSANEIYIKLAQLSAMILAQQISG